MPVKPVKGLRKRGYGGHLTKWQRYKLIHGGFGLAHDPFENEEEEKKAWVQNRDRLLAEYIKEHPGSRPAAFWKFDCAKDLRVVGESSWPDSKGVWHTKKEFESGFEFLKRKGLLRPGEVAPSWLGSELKMRKYRIEAHQERTKKE